MITFAALMFALQYKPLGYVFTALQVPASHFYRYTFLFSFFMIAFSAMFLKDIGEPEGKDIRGGVALTGTDRLSEAAQSSRCTPEEPPPRL